MHIRQVSFDDPDAVDGVDTVVARDAKINEGKDGSECFVYTSEASYGLPNMSFKEWKIWETCDVFGDGPLTNELLQGDTNDSGIEYTFPDTSGNGDKVCFQEDLPGSGGVSIHLLSRPEDSVTEITDSEKSDRERNSIRCDLSRDGSALVFDSDDNTLLPDDTQEDNQEHVFYTDDEGATFHRLVPDKYKGVDTTTTESKWGVLSGDGSYAAFHAFIEYDDNGDEASATAWETYLWRKSDKSIQKITSFKGNECNRTKSFEMMVEMYGIEELTSQDLADESKLGNGQTQCESFAAAGKLSNAGTFDVKDNPPSISDDGRFVTFMGSFASATMKGTLEPTTPVSSRNLFLYDGVLGITWAITKEYQSQTPYKSEGPIDIEAFCCPYASSSSQRDTCSVRNEMRQACCWQHPCYHPVVTNRISGTGDFVVWSTDMAPGDTTQVNMDWEIALKHIPFGETTQITDTDSKDKKDYYPSISRKGNTVAWTSDYNPILDDIIEDSQIFAGQVDTGCSRDSTASNYHPNPDVETCCEWDNVPEASDGEYLETKLTFLGDPASMKAHVAFFDEGAGESEAWCTAYVEQVRKDVACSLATPEEYVQTISHLDCSSWQKDEIEVTLFLTTNPVHDAGHTCERLLQQYHTLTSPLWNGYLTKTMKMDSNPSCVESKKSSKSAKSKSGKPKSAKSEFKAKSKSAKSNHGKMPESSGTKSKSTKSKHGEMPESSGEKLDGVEVAAMSLLLDTVEVDEDVPQFFDEDSTSFWFYSYKNNGLRQ